ncbi:Endosomal/lysomomal potassium channel TMEM175 [Hondaea fermentalgiana]|uniref:Endosomal/lysosomal proton channel TMEM175 n=1 Tax=Hondaea fermentalgiana TaxID=2315210 RepID=A0A2R5G2F9_9STRA|nr:Endosomal/lysomomal potassium channel TMEM175 [Hondaea fermentalgiana]|eukprot:GBG25182.1 Endosomal/lysomomal potassium channel TMEM175 [Hondaea fermentalgiana]
MGFERVQAYSDAVLSIVATVLAAPLLRMTEASKREILITGRSLRSVLLAPYKLQAMAVYYWAFMFVTLVWFWQGPKFHSLSTTPRATFLVYANYLELLVTSLLPFAASAAVNSDEASSGARSFSYPLYLNVFAVAATHLLFQTLALYVRETHRKVSWLHFEEACTILAVTGGVLIIAEWYAGFAFFAYLAIPPVVYFFRRRIACAVLQPEHSPSALPQDHAYEPLADTATFDARVAHAAPQRDAQTSLEGVFKNRLEAFTDGIIAVAATLTVLELTPTPACKELTDPEDCILHWQDGCRPTMPELLVFQCVYDDTEDTAHDKLLLISYLISFFVLHVFHSQHTACFETLTSGVTDLGIQLLNAHFGVFVGMLPFAFSLVTEFAIEPISENRIKPWHAKHKITPDEAAAKTACAFAGVILLLASLCLLGLLFRATWLCPTGTSRWPVKGEVLRFSVVPVLSLALVISLSLGASEALFLWAALILPLIIAAAKLAKETWALSSS